jgi:hypothetical protein
MADIDTTIYFGITTIGSFQKFIFPINSRQDKELSASRAVSTMQMDIGDLRVIVFDEVGLTMGERTEYEERIYRGVLRQSDEPFPMPTYNE